MAAADRTQVGILQLVHQLREAALGYDQRVVLRLLNISAKWLEAGRPEQLDEVLQSLVSDGLAHAEMLGRADDEAPEFAARKKKLTVFHEEGLPLEEDGKNPNQCASVKRGSMPDEDKC